MADRPWHRSLIKTGARLLLGGSRAHAQDWFPGLDIVRRNGVGEVFYHRAKVADLSSTDRLREQSGQTIHIVGSGPSIRDCDLTDLEKGSAVLLNGAIGLIGEQIAAPLAIAVEDERFVWRHSEMMRRRIRSGTICLFSVAVLRAISELDSRWLADKTIVLIDISNAGEPRFYETSDETAFSGIAQAEDRILEHFILAKEIASERGVTFVNYSPVSALLKHGFGYDARFAAVSTI
jgi:hypothetical protein